MQFTRRLATVFGVWPPCVADDVSAPLPNVGSESLRKGLLQDVMARAAIATRNAAAEARVKKSVKKDEVLRQPALNITAIEELQQSKAFTDVLEFKRNAKRTGAAPKHFVVPLKAADMRTHSDHECMHMLAGLIGQYPMADLIQQRGFGMDIEDLPAPRKPEPKKAGRPKKPGAKSVQK